MQAQCATCVQKTLPKSFLHLSFLRCFTMFRASPLRLVGVVILFATGLWVALAALYAFLPFTPYEWDLEPSQHLSTGAKVTRVYKYAENLHVDSTGADVAAAPMNGSFGTSHLTFQSEKHGASALRWSINLSMLQH